MNSTGSDEELIVLHLFADDYTPELSWELAHWCMTHRADEWAVTQMTVESVAVGTSWRFDAVMAPFQRQSARREQMSWSSSDEKVRMTDVWNLTPPALAALSEFLPEGLFSYTTRQIDWLEDPVFYRRGEVMLGIVSHDQAGFLCVAEEEQVDLQRHGFPFRASKE